MRAVAAITASLLIHAMGFAVVRFAMAGPAPGASTVTPPTLDLVTVDLTTDPMVGRGRATGGSPPPKSVVLSSRATKRASVALHPRPPKPLSRPAVTLVASPVSISTAAAAGGPALDPKAEGAPLNVEDLEDPAPTGATAASPAAIAAAIVAFDASPFLERLRHAAAHCGGPRKGRARVRFCVDAKGAPIDVSLVQSSGNFAFDAAALGCVVPGAAPFPHTDRCLVVPIAGR